MVKDYNMLKLHYMQEAKKQKIAFMITKGFWGGASKYIYDISKNLDQNLFEIYLICGKGDILPLKMTEIGAKIEKIETMERDFSIISEIKSFIKTYKIIQKIKPDILHLNSPKASSFGALVGRILDVKKIVTTIHGFTFYEDRNFLEKEIIKIITWFYMILSDKNIIISKKDLESAVKMPFISDKICYIKNGIDTKTEFKSKEIAKEYIKKIYPNIPENKLWLGTIAELHKNKGLDYLIESMKKNDDYILLITGDGQEKRSLELKIKKYNLENKVFLLGFQKTNEIIKAFDVFILASIKEGLPYVLLEAGLAKLPILASDIGGTPDIIKNQENGLLFPKGNIDKISENLTKIKNQELRETLSENIYRTIVSNFSLEKMLENTLKIYKN